MRYVPQYLQHTLNHYGQLQLQPEEKAKEND